VPPPAAPQDAPAPGERSGSAVAQAGVGLGVARLLVAWVAGVLAVQLLGTVATLVVVSSLHGAPLDLLGLVLAAVGVVVALAGVTVAVLTFGAGRAARRPWWHWLVAGVPALVLAQLVGAVVQLAVAGRVPVDAWVVAFTAIELVLGAALAVGVGALLRARAEARTRPVASPPAH
ncbi:hypothetical protein ICW40_07605, partial [Actinotalea ferrariae]|nr:hypothetical protein [Actinotalea ferrariae]